MDDYDIRLIANVISEEDSFFQKFQNQWEEKTVLGDDIYFNVIAILKDVCIKNDCILHYRKLAVDFIPPGLIIKNIYIDCPDPQVKAELAGRLAKLTNDETIKHTFDDNLRVNLYSAINKQFANRVREELNLDVTHQFRALPPGSNRAKRTEVLPMATITLPKVQMAQEPDEGMVDDMDIGAMGDMNPEPGPGDEGGIDDLPDLETGLGPPPKLGGKMPKEDPQISDLGEGAGLVSFEDITRIARLID